MIVEGADRLKNSSEYYFSKKLAEIQKMRNQGIDVINLGVGSPDLSPPIGAIEAARAALVTSKAHGYASYRASPELRGAMASWYKNIYGVTADPDTQILPLLGSKEGILYTSMAFLNPGDSVLVPNPGYPTYSAVAKLLGANVLHYNLTEANGWLPDFDELEKMNLKGCKIFWLNYPHMPTGKDIGAGVYSKLVEFVRRKKILLCSDNPYGLVLNRQPPRSLLEADPGFEVSLELNSLSKSFNMAGWRVGMALSAREVIDALLQVKSNVDSGMFSVVQAGAIEALKSPHSFQVEKNLIYHERRKLIYAIFDELEFTYDRDQVGLFVWAKAPKKIASHLERYLDEMLLKARVFLTPGMIFGSNGNAYARASLCAPVEIISEALKRIKHWKAEGTS
jgi:aspartate/methionine/tyrosine aminotransferase